MFPPYQIQEVFPLASHRIEVPPETENILESMGMMAIDGNLSGYVTIADEMKEDAHQAIQQIRDSGISKIIMLSGDKDSVTQQVAKELDIDWAKGGLPEDKLQEIEELKKATRYPSCLYRRWHQPIHERTQ